MPPLENEGDDMDADAKTDSAKTDSDDKRLNNLVAITVVILTVFMAISKVKDDNIVQAMQKAKSESVDAWAEYQSARIKLHIAENGLSMLRVLEAIPVKKTSAKNQTSEYETDIKKYQARSNEAMLKAKALEAEYERLNFRDDQFDMSDAFLSISIAVAAVAALTELFWLLMVAWAAGVFGITFGLAGFIGL